MKKKKRTLEEYSKDFEKASKEIFLRFNSHKINDEDLSFDERKKLKDKIIVKVADKWNIKTENLIKVLDL